MVEEGRQLDEGVGPLLQAEILSEWSWVLAYTALLTTFSILRYQLWLVTGYDMGWYEQGLWLLLHGGVLLPSSYLGYPILANTASYVLLLLAPLYRVFGIGFLLALQSFALAVGFLFLRRIARRLGVGELLARLLGFLYLLYPTLLAANLFDFHTEALGVPVLLGLAWAAVARRRDLFLLFLLAAGAVGDTTALVAALFGLALLLRREFLLGALAIAVGGGVVALDVLIVLPALAHGSIPQWSLYASLGPTPAMGLRFLLLHPAHLFHWLKAARSWEYLAFMAGPAVALLWLGRGRLLEPFFLAFLLVLEGNLLPGNPALMTPFNQYGLLAVPPLFVGLAFALAGRGEAAPLTRRRLLPLLIPALLFLAFVGEEVRINRHHIPPNAAALEAATALVPAGVPVVAQNFVEPRLSDRREIWDPARGAARLLPRGTYVLLDRTATDGITPPALLSAYGKDLAVPGVAKVVYQDPTGVVLYELLRPLRIAAGS